MRWCVRALKAPRLGLENKITFRSHQHCSHEMRWASCRHAESRNVFWCRVNWGHWRVVLTPSEATWNPLIRSFLGSWTERVDLHLLRQQQQRGVEFWLQSERDADDCRRSFLLDRLHHLLLGLHFIHEAVLCSLDVIKRTGVRPLQRKLLHQDLLQLHGALCADWWPVPVRR